jgi:hypothetical protein
MEGSSHHTPTHEELAATDIGLMVTGGAMFIISFFPWIGYSDGIVNLTANAWRIGFTTWFPVLLCMAVGAVAAARAFTSFQLPNTRKIGPNLLLAAVSALAVVWLVIRTINFLMESGNGGGTRFGLFLALITAIVQLVFAVRAFKSSGEPTPARHQP